MTVHAYVYKITNTITNEFYYGYRYKNQNLQVNPEQDLWIGYFTSSTRIKKDITKYGKNIFSAEVVYKDFDSLVCWKQEQILIKESWDNPLLLNGKYHDPDSNVELYRRVNLLSEKSRIKMSKSGKGRPKSESHKKKIAIANTGNIGSVQKRNKLSALATGKVMAVEISTNKKVKVTIEEFNLFKNIKYKGSTFGIVSAYDLIENKYCSVPREEFNNYKNTKYVGVNSKLIPK